MIIASGVIIGWGDTARPTHRLLAFDKKTGELRVDQRHAAAARGYDLQLAVSSVLDGQAALVFGSGDGGVHAWQPRTGKQIWNFDLSPRGLNVSPVVDDDRVYTSQAEENVGTTSMGTIVAIDGSKTGNITKTGEVWRQAGMVGKSSPLLVDGRLYAFDDGASCTSST